MTPIISFLVIFIFSLALGLVLGKFLFNANTKSEKAALKENREKFRAERKEFKENYGGGKKGK